jgi:hypothetical protein
MGDSIGAAHDPAVADYRATSPRWRAGRNMIALWRIALNAENHLAPCAGCYGPSSWGNGDFPHLALMVCGPCLQRAMAIGSV